jgi:hypothetical protein
VGARERAGRGEQQQLPQRREKGKEKKEDANDAEIKGLHMKHNVKK